MKTQSMCLAVAVVMLCATASAQWVQVIMPVTDVECLGVSGTDLFAGTWRNGVFRSTNYGTTWTAVNGGLPKILEDTTQYESIARFASIGENLWAETGAGVFLSTNSGTSWAAANTPFSEFSNMVQIGSNLFAGVGSWGHYSHGVYLSIDNGTTWTLVDSGLTDVKVTALAVSGTDLFAGTDAGGSFEFGGRGVFRSSNYGTTWTAVNAGLPIDPDDTTRCTPILSLASTGQNLFANLEYNGIYRSTNNGASWTEANDGLSVVPQGSDNRVWSLAVSGIGLFAGTLYGVFFTDDDGTTWWPFNDGIVYFGADMCIRAPLAVCGTNVYAKTEYNELWRLELMVSVPLASNEFPAEFTLSQNYPNPFNPSTTIKYELPNSSMVRLSVCDLLGREVSVLVNERRDAGVHEVKFDGSTLASGVYVYRFTAGGHAASRTMLLMK